MSANLIVDEQLARATRRAKQTTVDGAVTTLKPMLHAGNGLQWCSHLYNIRAIPASTSLQAVGTSWHATWALLMLRLDNGDTGNALCQVVEISSEGMRYTVAFPLGEGDRGLWDITKEQWERVPVPLREELLNALYLGQ